MSRVETVGIPVERSNGKTGKCFFVCIDICSDAGVKS